MSAVMTDAVPSSTTPQRGADRVEELSPVALVPGWIVWTVIIWEAWINLYLDAVYTAQFLSAPLIIAGLKWLMLALAAIVVSKLGRGRYLTQTLLRDLLSCWFLSALAWSVWIWFYNGPTGVQMVSSAAELDAPPDGLKLIIDACISSLFGTNASALAKSLAYAVETAIMLLAGVIVAAMLGSISRFVKRCFVSESSNDSGYQSVRQPRPLDWWFLLPAIVYVICNGIFAWAIRVGV
jgi:hypothetical protein